MPRIFSDDRAEARQDAVLASRLLRQEHEAATAGLEPSERSAPNWHGLGIEVLRLDAAEPFGGACP